jgi:His-Xaa-Ser system protein HxsD
MNADSRGNDCVTLSFPCQLFSSIAVEKAAYRFSDRVYADFSILSDILSVELRPIKALSLQQLEAIAVQFRIEVLDNELREKIALETAPIRNAVLAYAFSKTGLQDEL